MEKNLIFIQRIEIFLIGPLLVSMSEKNPNEPVKIQDRSYRIVFLWGKGRKLKIDYKFRIHTAYRSHLEAIIITNIIVEEITGSSFALGHNHLGPKDIFERYPQKSEIAEGERTR